MLTRYERTTQEEEGNNVQEETNAPEYEHSHWIINIYTRSNKVSYPRPGPTGTVVPKNTYDAAL